MQARIVETQKSQRQVVSDTMNGVTSGPRYGLRKIENSM